MQKIFFQVLSYDAHLKAGMKTWEKLPVCVDLGCLPLGEKAAVCLTKCWYKLYEVTPADTTSRFHTFPENVFPWHDPDQQQTQA